MTVYLKSFVLADAVLFDALTQKWTIVGVSDAVRVLDFPALLPRFSAFVQVADVGGELSGEFQVLDPDLQLLGSVKTPPAFAARLDSPEFMAIFGGAVVKKPGLHSVQFLINGKVVATTKLTVEKFVPHHSGG